MGLGAVHKVMIIFCLKLGTCLRLLQQQRLMQKSEMPNLPKVETTSVLGIIAELVLFGFVLVLFSHVVCSSMFLRVLLCFDILKWATAAAALKYSDSLHSQLCSTGNLTEDLGTVMTFHEIPLQ